MNWISIFVLKVSSRFFFHTIFGDFEMKCVCQINWFSLFNDVWLEFRGLQVWSLKNLIRFGCFKGDRLREWCLVVEGSMEKFKWIARSFKEAPRNTRKEEKEISSREIKRKRLQKAHKVSSSFHLSWREPSPQLSNISSSNLALKFVDSIQSKSWIIKSQLISF